MLRDKKYILRVLTTLLLAGSLFGAAVGKQRARRAGEQTGTAGSGYAHRHVYGHLYHPRKPSPRPRHRRKRQPRRRPTPPPRTSGLQTNTRTPTRTPSLTQTRGRPRPPSPIPEHSQPPLPARRITSLSANSARWDPLGAEDEFVELYNPTGAPVNIGNWMISKSSGCGTSISTLVTIYYGTVLQPGQHYLVAAYASSSSVTNADQRFSPGIADNGGLALVSSGGYDGRPGRDVRRNILSRREAPAAPPGGTAFGNTDTSTRNIRPKLRTQARR